VAINAFVKIMCGVAPIRVETGRYENIKLEEICCLKLFKFNWRWNPCYFTLSCLFWYQTQSFYWSFKIM